MLVFAHRNPQSCPLLDVGEAGEVSTPLFDGDLRTDLPAYVVYERGEPVAEVTDVSSYWRDDLVAFLIGCSFTFEAAARGGRRAGAPRRGGDQRADVPHLGDRPRPPGRCTDRWWSRCVRSRPTSSPRRSGSRPATPRCTGLHCTSATHRAIGIDDLDHPDFGEPVEVRAGEVPVFWGCGVTPQAAVMASRPDFAIGHAPGHMAITDARDSGYLVP